MSFAPEFHVPGAYRFDNNTTRSSQPLSAGIFRPPVSPSASSYNLTGSLYSDASMSNTGPANTHGTAKRKRMSTRESTPVEWNMNMDGANDARKEEKRRDAGRQIQYTLAGQINATPGAVPAGAENGILEDSVYSDVDYRRALGPKNLHDETDSLSVQLDTGGLGLDKPDGQNPGKWSSLALHTIGDVMGKVWEFCKGGGFRGFHAGGGTGYDLEQPTASQTGKPWCNEHDIPTLPNDDPQVDPPSYNNGVPGQFPQSDFMPFSPEYHEMNTPESTPRPAAKRRQVSGNDELKRNWVLVEEKAEQDRRPRGFGAALSKAPSRPSTATGRRSGHYAHASSGSGRRINVPISRLGSGTPTAVQRGRTSLRISQTGSPILPQREPASFAPPRSPVRTTPSRIPVPSQSVGPSQGNNPFAFPSSSAASLSRPSSRQSLSRLNSPVALPRTGPSNGAPSPSPNKSIGHRRNQSSASAAPTARRATLSSRVDVDDIQASPRLTAEAKQLAQKKLAAERDADMKVDAFNARLLRMIRQGKEALGTKVEVIEDDLGAAGGPVGGWEDDD